MAKLIAQKIDYSFSFKLYNCFFPALRKIFAKASLLWNHIGKAFRILHYHFDKNRLAEMERNLVAI